MDSEMMFFSNNSKFQGIGYGTGSVGGERALEKAVDL